MPKVDNATLGGAEAVERALRALAQRRPPGSRLPSVRELMRTHAVGPATVEAVLGRLAREGVLVPRPGEGTFVAEAPTPRSADHTWQTLALGAHVDPGESPGTVADAADRSMIDLAAAHPEPALQPRVLLARAAARAAAEPASWDAVDPAGQPALRRWFAQDIGGGISAEDVVITAGGQAALVAAFSALARPGDALVVESPGDVAALAAARVCGLRPVPVPTDAHGVRPEHLEAALQRSGARLAHLQPLLANPTGATLAPERRAAVADVLVRHGAFAVEDDRARELAEAGAPPPLLVADPDGHLVLVRSLCLTTAPGLRVAAVAGAAPLRNAACTLAMLRRLLMAARPPPR